MDNINGWPENKKLVEWQLVTLTNKVDKIDTKIDEIKNDVTMLKVKSWIFGLAGGVIVTAVLQIVIRLLT